MPAAITMPITTAAEAITRGSPSAPPLEIESRAEGVMPLKSAKDDGR
jgi:hypothetical protein